MFHGEMDLRLSLSALSHTKMHCTRRQRQKRRRGNAPSAASAADWHVEVVVCLDFGFPCLVVHSKGN